MIFRQLFDQTSSTYTYLLASRHGGEALIIDPVLERVDRYIQLLRELDLRLVKAIDTHLHADHITGSGKIRKLLGTQAVVHKNSQSDCADWLVSDGDIIELGSYAILVLDTPGHTDTCITYQTDGYVFTGDTLLIRGCGRTDFQSGDPGQLYDSIHSKLFTLPDDTIIYPGHDYHGFTSSTIGEEKAHNPRLGNNRSREDFVNLMNSLELEPPKKIDEAVPGNLECGLKQG